MQWQINIGENYLEDADMFYAGIHLHEITDIDTVPWRYFKDLHC